MSKLLFVCFKNEIPKEAHVDKVRFICDSLNPDNINPNPTKLITAHKILIGISNPVPSIETEGINIFFGQAFGEKKDWYSMHSAAPDGNYALFKANEDEVQINSDILGTRATWYYQDENYFIASTSQRAMIQFLENFEFDEEVIPWILTNGILGPGLSWDKRLSLLPPDSSLHLDIKSWEVKIKTEDIKFETNKKSDKENIEDLQKILKSTFSKLNLDYSQWKLSLSGGYDSRGNIYFLPRKDNKGVVLNTITWGQSKLEKVKGGDARVAKKVAGRLQVIHKYFPTETGEEDLENVIDRFLKNGEGRIDHIGGYTDGFFIWKNLYESGITGIIRGDEVFGSHDFISDFHLRKFFGLICYDEFDNLKKNVFFKNIFQGVPKKYNRESGESFAKWRDRLYQSIYVPYFLSALSDLKDPYVEQINPFLSREVVRQVRKMPDHLRTEKKAFKMIVASMEPKIEFATSASIIQNNQFLQQKKVIEMIKEELNSPLGRSIFPAEFLSLLLGQFKGELDSAKWYGQVLPDIKSLIPKSIKRKLLKQTFVPMMDMKKMAFRAVIIIKMIRIFEDDIAQIFKKE